ncbi:hypothetical protein Poly24_20640 [Rosistilla carotiformis]|uniref:Uncharacterized protein n=1 Tax=Rosistilla carotiformis TaxID=2528017 RepID=A0A518JS54_9BACT|nr:hypothetical protein [Rosistilla carotiformis]QDV68355.1 hypothetical protein Poly24_20640 [Rosistilla carotiformis]
MRPRFTQLIGCVLLALVIFAQLGCTSALTSIMYAVGADLEPAEYKDLARTKTAVVVITDGSQYSDDITSRTLTRKVSEYLEIEVDGIKLIAEEEIDSWKDINGWEQVDFIALGKGIKADKVLGIELTGLKLREGQTLYRGRANVTTTVYDVKSGRKEFRRSLDDFTFPVHTGKYASETTEAKFRRDFLDVLSRRVARYFHRYDPRDSVALDAVIVNL